MADVKKRGRLGPYGHLENNQLWMIWVSACRGLVVKGTRPVGDGVFEDIVTLCFAFDIITAMVVHPENVPQNKLADMSREMISVKRLTLA